MNTSLDPEPSFGPAGDEAALVSALESAPAAIYCFTAAAEAVWANARARSLGTARSSFPLIDGRPVAELIDDVLRTGRPETVSGPLDGEETSATAVAQPIRVGGGPGVLLVLETGGAQTVTTLWPKPVDVVEQAQLSLLPPSLPMLPDLRLSGSYHRASSSRAAGGDWYDAVPLGAGRVALVVGDAVGHGVPAAGAMSRLRGAMRSTAQRDPSPRAVLAALDDFAAEMEDVEGASVFYGVLDAGDGTLTYGAAGHPPPLVVHPDGRTSLLSGTPRPPLGSLPGVATQISELTLEQGATLVLFSNGALAAPDTAAPEDAVRRLAEVSRSVLRAPGALEAEAAGELASAVAEGVRRPQAWPDDVAVLVAHRREASLDPLELDLVATPAVLPGIRRQLGVWLTGLGMGEQDRVGVMVAVGEACANAAEHAYRGTEPGPMSVSAQVDVDGVLTVTVRDEGTWRPPDRDPGDRGRGLLIMRQLVDTVTLDERTEGTTVTLRVRLRRTPDVDTDVPANTSGATVRVDREGSRPVVSAEGAVDEIGAQHMRIRLLEASHGGTSPVELDLTGVTVFSSAAIRVVLAIARIGRGEGWRLVVRAPGGGITRQVLEISGLAGLVDLH